MNNTIKVLIVGAGPVGLTTACELAAHGVSCTIIDKNTSPNTFSKAFAVHSRTLEVFKRMGLEKQILNAGKKVEEANFYDEGKKFLSTQFSKLKEYYPFLIALPQNRVEAILENKLNELGVYVTRGVSLLGIKPLEQASMVNLEYANGKEVQVMANYVVAADGSRSKIRSLLNIPFKETKYKNAFIVVDAKVKWEGLKNSADTFLTKKGYLMLTPFPDKEYYRLVLGDKATENRKTPTLEEVNSLKDAYGFEDLKITEPIWISKTNVQKRIIEKYRHQTVFFAGDAAHINSPVGGQGMNLGIQDAHNLAWKLAFVCKGFLGNQLLSSYQSERRKIAMQVLKATHIMNKALVTKNPLMQTFRNTLYTKVSKNKILSLKLAEKGAGLDYNYKNGGFYFSSSIDKNNFSHKKVQPGYRVSEIIINDLYYLGKKSKQLFNNSINFLVVFVLNDRHSINNSILFSNTVQLIAKSSGFEMLEVSEEKFEAIDHSVVQQIKNYFGVQKDAVIIIRPDGFILTKYTKKAEMNVLHHLEKHLVTQQELSFSE